MANMTEWLATGRRKKASARIRLRPGSGNTTMHGQDGDPYIRRPTAVMRLPPTLIMAVLAEKSDSVVNVRGGAKNGQAGAVLHGISRALCEFDAALRPTLKATGTLTRDAR